MDLKRLAVITSHPIFYQEPLWQLLGKTKDIDLTVFFESDKSLRPHYDLEFGKIIEWDLPLAQGYDHVFIKGYWDLISRLRRGSFSALLVHGWNSPISLMALFAARILGIHILMRSESPWNQEIIKPFWKLFLKKVFLGAVFIFVDAFLYIGEENKYFYRAYGVPEEKLFFTPYAVDNTRLLASVSDPEASRNKIRAKFAIPDDIVIFLTNGKLIPKKRHMDLICAYEKIDGHKKALIIISEGYMRQELEEYVNIQELPNVFFAGFVKQTEIGEYYSAVDVFVFTSGEGETWGLVVNEALCFGLPVIASDMVGSGSDLVKDGVNGFVFKTGDIEALKDLMEKLMNNKTLRIELGKKSKELIKKYSYEEDLRGITQSLRIK